MSNETAVPAAVVENKKPVVEPLIGDNGEQTYLIVGDAKIPMLRKTTPAHTRKKGGVQEIVKESVKFVADYSDSAVFLLAATLALSSVSAEDKPSLTERIFSPWVDDAIEKGTVADPSTPGETIWDENVVSKNLCLARAARKTGASIADLRAEQNELNNVLVPILEICIGATNGEEPNWAEVQQLTGTRIDELEALVEWRINAKQRLNNLNATIRAKEAAMEQAKAKRKGKKKGAVEAAAEVAA